MRTADKEDATEAAEPHAVLRLVRQPKSHSFVVCTVNSLTILVIKLTKSLYDGPKPPCG